MMIYHWQSKSRYPSVGRVTVPVVRERPFRSFKFKPLRLFPAIFCSSSNSCRANAGLVTVPTPRTFKLPRLAATY
jgi:hypothetical protein